MLRMADCFSALGKGGVRKIFYSASAHRHSERAPGFLYYQLTGGEIAILIVITDKFQEATPDSCRRWHENELTGSACLTIIRATPERFFGSPYSQEKRLSITIFHRNTGGQNIQALKIMNWKGLPAFAGKRFNYFRFPAPKPALIRQSGPSSSQFKKRPGTPGAERRG